MLFFANKQLLLLDQVIAVPTTALCILPVQTAIYLLVAVCQPAPISGTTLGTESRFTASFPLGRPHYYLWVPGRLQEWSAKILATSIPCSLGLNIK